MKSRAADAPGPVVLSGAHRLCPYNPNEREPMLKHIAGLLCLAVISTMPAAAGEIVGVKIPAKFAYVGGYTTPKREGKAKGLEVFAIDAEGAWSNIQTVEMQNPSYLALNPSGDFLYACQGDGTEVAAFAVDKDTGRVSPLNTAQTTGVNGVHLAVSSDNKRLAVANYSGGTVDMFALNADGSIGARTGSVDTAGETGALKSQKGSYPHQVVFSKDGRFLFAPDKGRDLVHSFAIDADGGIAPASAMYSRPGVGSRHLDFHPAHPYAYVVEECDNSVTACRLDAETGRLEPTQWVSLVPDTYFFQHRGTNEEGGAAIWVDKEGDFVYATQRGLNTIGVFAIDKANGSLKTVGWHSSQGVRPRFFTFDPSGKYVFLGNQMSDNIVVYEKNKQTGSLQCLGTVAETGSPVCILFK